MISIFIQSNFSTPTNLSKMSKERNIHSVLKYNILLLNFIGLWPPERRSVYYSVFSVVAFLFFVFLDAFFMLLNMPNILGNLDNFSSYLAILSIKIIGCSKWIFFVYNIKIIKSLVSSLYLEEFQAKNIAQHDIMMTSLKTYTIAFRLFFAIATSSCFMYLFLPILTKQKRLPFDSWYPCQYSETPCYEVSYLHQAVSTILTSYTNVGIDNFSAALMSIIRCQCEILRHTILNMYDFTMNEYKKKKEVSDHEEVLDFYNEYFRNINSHYWYILEFAKDVNKIFCYYVFGQMALCVLLFCTAMFRLSVVKPESPEFLTVVVFIITIGVQLFLYCWFGNEVEVQSSKLHLAAFHCNWVGTPISFQKRLLFFTRRTAKPIRIFALNFFPLSVATFTAIMRSSWSFFAVLNQVHNRE